MEHIIVPPAWPGDPVSTEERIRDQVQKKQDKGGAQYARGKTLLVFNELSDNTNGTPIKPRAFCRNTTSTKFGP